MHRLRYSQQQTDGGKPVENSVPPQAPASMIALITDFQVLIFIYSCCSVNQIGEISQQKGNT